MPKSALRERIVPAVPFILHVEDGEGSFDTSFRLAYDLNAITAFDKETNGNFLKDYTSIFEDVSVANVTALLWAAVQINHPEYAGPEGLLNIRRNLGFFQLADALGACSRAFVAQLPQRKDDTGPLAQGPAPTTTA